MLRRNFIRLSTVASLWIVTGCGSSSVSSAPSPSITLITGEALTIPPLLNPSLVNGIKSFDISIAESSHNFYTGQATKTYAMNGTYLGPTLLLKNGEDVEINYKNNLAEKTTIHGHGMHLPPSMDGGPHQVIDVGATWTAKYTVNQKACTNWYHPHYMGKTAEHVYKGLAGMIIIEDSESQNLALPKTYGVDDIPLVVQDRVFDGNYQFDYTPTNMEIMQGYRGDTFIVNGQVSPVFDAKSGLLRLRLLNGSNAGVYEFSFADGRAFSQIATDNGFLEAPVSLTKVRLSPAERAEIVVDLSADAGKEVQLKVNETIDNRSDTLLTLKVQTASASVSTLPSVLTILDTVDTTLVQNTRTFTLEGQGGGNPVLTINGKEMDINVINERVPLNQVETWEITNTMNIGHNFHIHATHFRLIERNGSTATVAANEKGYKDTVFIPANEKVKIYLKMIDYADTTVPYMYHCHFLEHEDAGMMGQFTVE